MKYIKKFEVDFTSHKKFSMYDYVYVTGNKNPAQIIDLDYEDPYLQYYCKFTDGRQIWYNEIYLTKLEDWEVKALKYNL